MAAATDLQALLRFLSHNAKVPLATAMSKVKELQAAQLGSPELLAKAKATDLKSMFDDEKVCKQIIAAAKRVSKKRAAGEDITASPKKSRKNSTYADPSTSPPDLETTLELPTSDLDEAELSKVVVHSNRAPLFLAFTLTLLKYTMPAQPLSSRLSLAQAFISTSSRSRAVSLGIQTLGAGEVEAEQKLAEGQPIVKVMGKELPVLRRWGYEWKRDYAPAENDGKVQVADSEDEANVDEIKPETAEAPEGTPALWALDLEALRKSNNHDISFANAQAGNNSTLPIYTPQSARAYLIKAFDSPASEKGDKAASAASRRATKERNLGHLLQALELLYGSWAPALTADELDGRTWGWYVQVRPDVEQGVAGWGGKNEIKLEEILALRRDK